MHSHELVSGVVGAARWLVKRAFSSPLSVSKGEEREEEIKLEMLSGLCIVTLVALSHVYTVQANMFLRTLCSN